MSRTAKILAELLEPVEAETSYGGRSTTYLPLGPLWLSTLGAAVRGQVVAGREHATERRTVEAREDERVIVGRILRFGGGDWRIGARRPARFGWAVLSLEAAR